MNEFRERIRAQYIYCDNMLRAFESRPDKIDRYYYYYGMRSAFAETINKTFMECVPASHKYMIHYLKGCADGFKMCLDYAKSIMNHLDNDIRDNY